MITASIQKLRESDVEGDWSPELQGARDVALSKYPHSVLVEGYYPEHDVAVEWATSAAGQRDVAWTSLWYAKTDYDYGFQEFFFVDEADATSFEKAAITFYAMLDSENKRWRSEGPANQERKSE